MQLRLFGNINPVISQTKLPTLSLQRSGQALRSQYRTCDSTNICPNSKVTSCLTPNQLTFIFAQETNSRAQAQAFDKNQNYATVLDEPNAQVQAASMEAQQMVFFCEDTAIFQISLDLIPCKNLFDLIIPSSHQKLISFCFHATIRLHFLMNQLHKKP